MTDNQNSYLKPANWRIPVNFVDRSSIFASMTRWSLMIRKYLMNDFFLDILCSISPRPSHLTWFSASCLRLRSCILLNMFPISSRKALDNIANMKREHMCKKTFLMSLYKRKILTLHCYWNCPNCLPICQSTLLTTFTALTHKSIN